MPKLRVYEVAKELDINSGRVLEKLREIGVEVKNHMSTLDDGEIARIKEVFRKKTDLTEPPKPRVAPVKPTAEQAGAQLWKNQPSQQRPQGQRPQGQRPQGQRPQGQRPQGQSLQGQPPRYGQPGQQPRQAQPGQQPRQAQPGQQPRQAQPGQQPRPEQQGQRPPRQGQPRQGQPGAQRPDYHVQGQGQGQGQRPPRQGQRQDYQGQRQDYQGQRPPRQGQPGAQRQDYQGQRPQGQRPPRPAGQVPRTQPVDRPQRQPGFTGQRQTPKPGQEQRPGQPQRSRPGQKPPGQRGGKPFEGDDRSVGRKPLGAGAKPGSKPGLQKQTGYKRQDISKPAPKTSPKSKQKSAPKPQPEVAPLVFEEDGIKVLRIGKSIQVKELASRLAQQNSEIIKQLMKMGMMVTVNEEIDYYTAAQIAEGYNAIVEKADEMDILEQAFADDTVEDENETGKPRPPIVVVMGHVDHGKTSLLDRIRKSSVATAEAGGITQHIGAYTVSAGGKVITFLDTPGHEAFTAMRMRGARATDIAILVVAADDGVMPQTIEAINHAKAAGVEIIVAINKMDKPSANPDRVKQELTEHGILVEEWGGEIICCPVSALKGDGIEHLLEMILLSAEMKELKADPNRKARGTVIEALLDKTRGPIATVLVQSGTLRVGDPVVAGSTFGKVRAMMDDKGRKLKSAGPSMPVEILGLSEVPRAGDMFYTANSEKHARQVAESVVAQGRVDMIKAAPKVSLNDLFNQIQAGNVKDLNIVIKADVQGSVEAVKNSLERLSNDEVRIRTLHGGVGAVTESDVMLASASNAIIIGFNVRIETNAKAVADAENVDIRIYRIIYNAIEDVTAAMKGMLEPVYQEKVIGHAEIRQIFKASGVGNIGGSYITDGKFTRNSKIRIFRGEEKVYEGELETLKRFKDDVKEVASGYECGLLFRKFNDIAEGDRVEAYVMEEVPR